MWSLSLQWQVDLTGAVNVYVSFILFIFLELIVTCRLCVIYVREDNDSSV